MKRSHWMLMGTGGVAGAAITAALTLAYPIAQADTSAANEAATIAVTGHADEWVQPDVCVIDAGVVTKASDAQTAQRQNDAAMQKVLDALKQAGVPQSQVQTQWYSLQPSYGRPDTNGNPTMDGFQATDEIEVTVKDLSKVGDIVDVLVNAGANQINNVSYQVSNPKAIRTQLYQEALADAKEQAQRLAQAAGVTISGVRSVDASGGAAIPLYQGKMVMAAADSAAAPITPGPQDVSCDIQVVFTATPGSGS